MAYALDFTKNHRLSLLELADYDNAGTIETELDLSNTTVSDAVAVDPVGGSAEDIAAYPTHKFSAILTNKNAVSQGKYFDTVKVYFNKVDLSQKLVLSAAVFQDWYDSDTWEESDSLVKAQGLAAIKAAALAQGIDLEALTTGNPLTIKRVQDSVTQRYYIVLEGESLVFRTDVNEATGRSHASWQLPQQFSDIVTVTELDGFNFSPIAAASVVE